MTPDPEGAFKDGFTWDESKGIGHYPVRTFDQYNRDYWDKYVGYKTNSIGTRLTRARAELVERYYGDGLLVDIGIGCGHFIEVREERSGRLASDIRTFGYDVNPVAIRWLLDRGCWWDPFFRDPEAIACWDSLEHMNRPEALVMRVTGVIFLSIPIFDGRDHALRSRHYRPNEHYWYFTRKGLVDWMGQKGFCLVTENRMETDLGREDIGTFVFRRYR